MNNKLYFWAGRVPSPYFRKDMRNLLMVVLVFGISEGIGSQVIADAGNDTSMCITWDSTSTLQLGGFPAATGGTPPYTYSWGTQYDIVFGSNTFTLTASDFLSDTTAANPEMIHTEEGPVEFILTITDSNGFIDKDTIVVSFSVFDTHLFQWEHNMVLGDSVKFVSLPNVSGGQAPLTYLWKPNHGLSDSTAYTNFWVKPTQSTNYYITIKDAAGCEVEGPPVFFVYVGYLELDDLQNNTSNEIIVYPNPSNGIIRIHNFNHEITEFSLYNSNNQLLKQFALDQSDFDLTDLPKGTYFLKVALMDRTIQKRIILR